MSYVFQLSDAQYARLAAYAAQQQQTSEALLQAWVNEVTHHIEAFSSLSRSEQADQEGQEGCEEDALTHPLVHVAGMFAIGEPGWADKHDEYLVKVYGENHAHNQ